MSDTPRTDALEDQYFENRNHVSEVFLHAQQLERELAEARRQRDKAIAAERERCAKVCEEMANSRYQLKESIEIMLACADAIRKGE